jgi:peptidyl-prolyl cis-trans isomerase B (cyclophilin B)
MSGKKIDGRYIFATESSANKNDLIFSIVDNTGNNIEIKNSEGGGCLIATAAFGSELSSQVQFLREIRDSTVLQTELGTSFMIGFNQFYYSFSPTIADYERENPVFKEVVKLTLTPLLTSLTLLQYADIDSESEMLGYGIGIILLNIGMYFVAPAVLIMKVKKRI